MNGQPTPEPTYRPPLGLPPGSVRALLSLMICALFWLLLLLPKDPSVRPVKIPPHVYILLGLVVLFFFAHGKSIATRDHPTPSPLWLPGGFIRLITAGGTIAVLAYLSITDREALAERLTPDLKEIEHWSTYLLAAVIGLAAGIVLRAFRYIHSWLAVVALLIMAAEIIIEVFVLPRLREHMEPWVWRGTVVGVTAGYFGTRT